MQDGDGAAGTLSPAEDRNSQNSQKYCWAAHKFTVSLRSENCSVGSRQLGNEIRSQFSNAVFQKRENDPAESFLRESKAEAKAKKGKKT